MNASNRPRRDIRRYARSLAAAGAATVKSTELAVAASRVIAGRMALGFAAFVDPWNADHAEFARIVPEKIEALSETSAILHDQSRAMVDQITRFTTTEATIALHATNELACCYTPLDVFAVHNRLALGWFARVVSQSIAMSALAMRSSGALIAPLHRAATGNAKRLER